MKNKPLFILSNSLLNVLLKKESSNVARIIKIGLPCFLAFYFVVQHFYPGAMSPDSINILTQARTDNISDSFPIFNVYLWKFLDQYVVEGPAGMLVLNMLLYYAGLFMACYSLAKTYSRLSSLVCMLFGFFPPIIGILGAVWSDITLTSLLMFLLGLSVITGFGAERDTLSKPVKYFVAIIGLVIAFAAVSTRHNAAAAVIPMVFLLFSSLMPNLTKGNAISLVRFGRLLAVFLLAVMATVGFFAASKYLNNAYTVEKKNFWRVTVLYDLTGISCRTKKDYLSEILESGQGMDNICALYTPNSYIPLVFGEQIHELDAKRRFKGVPLKIRDGDDDINEYLLKHWMSVIIDNPIAYFKHRADFFLALTTRSFGALWAPVFDAIYSNELGVAARDKVDSTVFEEVRSLSLNSIIFLPIVYALLALVVFGISFVVILKQNSLSNRILSTFALAVSLSGLLHLLGVSIFAVSSDFRYSHWLIVSSLMSVALLLFSFIENESNYK
ncbi:hypothetical protein ACODG7_12265 [Vibrio anguillarum]|uniref:Uncharacterized protein n=1 Tax=Vibrio ordalii FS-238 TaxID=617133 RepID=A0A853R380_9VIBR|nr:MULTISPECIES: hypothetical protein [Vibrio]MDQ2192071.1 hypothetical protein [Vibrio sp. A14(2019)]MDQ2197054.1 hypothetical protein [Vibrio sp. 2017_1457_11]NNN76241.1 hypothetical protein [Vibrio sp. B7]NNN92832.1 hypothetical protein [Vibrio sp. B8-1]NNO08317.1 hypothetical protein [Vibrio sp. B4-12]